jgi:hypothetical protein
LEFAAGGHGADLMVLAPGRRERGCRRSCRWNPRPQARSPRRAARQHLGDRRLRHRDRRREQPHLQLLGGGRRDGLRQQGWILAAHERLSHADPQLPMAAGYVVN